MNEPYREFDDVSDAKAQQEIEQMHALAMDKLRDSEDFVLICFDTETQLWRTLAAIGKFQTPETVYGLLNCLQKIHDRVEQTNMYAVSRAILQQNAESWRDMDEMEKASLVIMLAMLLGEEAAKRVIQDLENQLREEE